MIYHILNHNIICNQDKDDDGGVDEDYVDRIQVADPNAYIHEEDVGFNTTTNNDNNNNNNNTNN